MTKLIPLTRGFSAIVDDADFDWLMQWKWHYLNKGYAVRSSEPDEQTGKRSAILMHRFIMNTPRGMDTDHRNRNKLDNQRSNLRIATRPQNAQNARRTANKYSIYKGVSRHLDRWRVQIHAAQKRIHIGLFASELEAARAYDHAAVLHLGEFAVLNFPQEQYP